MTYNQRVVKTISAGHNRVSECAEGVTLDKRMRICSVWEPLYAPYELRNWTHMAVSAQHIFLGNVKGMVKMFSRATPYELPVTILKNNSILAVSHLALSRDTQHLLIITQQKHAYTYEIDTGNLQKLPPILAQIPFNPLSYLMCQKHVTGCWAPNNSDVLMVYNSKPLLYHGETRTWRDIDTKKVAEEGIVMLPLCAWSPRHRDTFVLVGVGKVFCVWLYIYNALQQLKLTILFATKKQAHLTALEYSGDGCLLMVATRLYPFVHFFSPVTGDFLFSLQFSIPNYQPYDWVTHVQFSHADDTIHVAYKKSYFIHELQPNWKKTMLQIMLVWKGRGRGRGRGGGGRRLPPELWHIISWDFRDALLLSVNSSLILPIVIHNRNFF